MEYYDNILEKIDWNVLNQYIKNDLIIVNKHPKYNLWILNYTQNTQFNKLWDLYTISCRGLVIDDSGNILARPFKKFFNYEEHSIDEIPTDQNFEVFEKMDGSLIILFYYSQQKEWIIVSRGSFISDQVKEAEKIINKENLKYLNKDNTYLFELITPENRIVVNYGNIRDLVLLGSIKTKSGIELNYNELKKSYSKYFTIVDKINVTNFNDLIRLRENNDENREGFVIKSNKFRLKLKFKEYIRLRAIITNVSNLTVWGYLKDGYDFDTLTDKVPDEFYDWLMNTKNQLKNRFNEIEEIANKEFFDIYCLKGIVNRKEFAEKAKRCKYTSILFRIYDMKPYNQIIWRNIRPNHSKPFQDGY